MSKHLHFESGEFCSMVDVITKDASTPKGVSKPVIGSSKKEQVIQCYIYTYLAIVYIFNVAINRL